MAQRGSYAKGVAKREEILERALDVVAREGYRGASVKEIADAAGLSQAGLLHYFDSKEELFTEILRKRDELDHRFFGGSESEAESGGPAAFLEVIRHNTRVPGLVALYSRLAVDGADPSHPAHAYFLDRNERMRASFVDEARALHERGELATTIDPETIARLVQAVADGIQLQWLLDPSVDMTATVAALFDVLLPATSGATGSVTDGR